MRTGNESLSALAGCVALLALGGCENKRPAPPRRTTRPRPTPARRAAAGSGAELAQPGAGYRFDARVKLRSEDKAETWRCCRLVDEVTTIQAVPLGRPSLPPEERAVGMTEVVLEQVEEVPGQEGVGPGGAFTGGTFTLVTRDPKHRIPVPAISKVDMTRKPSKLHSSGGPECGIILTDGRRLTGAIAAVGNPGLEGIAPNGEARRLSLYRIHDLEILRPGMADATDASAASLPGGLSARMARRKARDDFKTTGEIAIKRSERVPAKGRPGANSIHLVVFEYDVSESKHGVASSICISTMALDELAGKGEESMRFVVYRGDPADPKVPGPSALTVELINCSDVRRVLRPSCRKLVTSADGASPLSGVHGRTSSWGSGTAVSALSMPWTAVLSPGWNTVSLPIEKIREGLETGRVKGDLTISFVVTRGHLGRAAETECRGTFGLEFDIPRDRFHLGELVIDQERFETTSEPWHDAYFYGVPAGVGAHPEGTGGSDTSREAECRVSALHLRADGADERAVTVAEIRRLTAAWQAPAPSLLGIREVLPAFDMELAGGEVIWRAQLVAVTTAEGRRERVVSLGVGGTDERGTARKALLDVSFIDGFSDTEVFVPGGAGAR